MYLHLPPSWPEVLLRKFKMVSPAMIYLEANCLKRNKQGIAKRVLQPLKIHAVFLRHGVLARSSCPVGDDSSQHPIPFLTPFRWLVLASEI